MATTVTIHGIKACDTMKKARMWLNSHGVEYTFHDYKVQGIGHDLLMGWVRAVGWEALLNRAGTTFRKLPDADKAAIDAAKAVALMIAQPSIVKRPVLMVSSALIVGFKPEAYAAAFA